MTFAKESSISPEESGFAGPHPWIAPLFASLGREVPPPERLTIHPSDEMLLHAIRQANFCKFLRQAKSVKDIEEIFREVEETARV